jgi:hypothetical protein
MQLGFKHNEQHTDTEYQQYGNAEERERLYVHEGKFEE